LVRLPIPPPGRGTGIIAGTRSDSSGCGALSPAATNSDSPQEGENRDSQDGTRLWHRRVDDIQVVTAHHNGECAAVEIAPANRVSGERRLRKGDPAAEGRRGPGVYICVVKSGDAAAREDVDDEWIAARGAVGVRVRESATRAE